MMQKRKEEFMSVKIALAGNPNSGKTTLFNALTGSNQFVGNWPGVTVEKKEGKLKQHDDILIVDLPGIYSLSAYTLEEVVARNYLINERPDVILNIIDGTNIERNLYLTTQLTELGIPVVVAVNMIDVVKKNGDEIKLDKLSKELGCEAVEISALKGTGITEAAELAIKAANGAKTIPQHRFSGAVEHVLAHIEEAAVHNLSAEKQRWYSIKIFERDSKVLEELNLSEEIRQHIEEDIQATEKELDDDSESIITNERYLYVDLITQGCYFRKNKDKMTTSDKIDRILTNRFAALPIFAAIMFAVYFISVTTVGTWVTDWTNDGLFGDGFTIFGKEVPGIPVLVENGLTAINCNETVISLVVDGIVGGVGAVLGFVPQMLVLFIFLAFLESCGYMARIAFVMDKIFHKFGLSGKSFIPMLIGTGCSVPGIMASRTIENDRDRKMTIITTSFIPCGAKLPIIALIASALFDGAWWVAPSAYFIGIAAVIISGIMLKKTKLFAGDSAPFVMELPAYHMPTFSNVMRSMWERGWSFIKKAGTVILLSTILIWAADYFGILESIGNAVKWIFVPLGFGSGKMGSTATVATIMGLVAKEEVVAVIGVTEGTTGFLGMSSIAAYSFMLFNLLCAPCFAAMGAIKREMNSAKWTLFAIAYQTLFAYVVSFVVYQLGMLFTGNGNMILAGIAFVLVALLIYMIVRPHKEARKL